QPAAGDGPRPAVQARNEAECAHLFGEAIQLGAIQRLARQLAEDARRILLRPPIVALLRPREPLWTEHQRFSLLLNQLVSTWLAEAVVSSPLHASEPS